MEDIKKKKDIEFKVNQIYINDFISYCNGRTTNNKRKDITHCLERLLELKRELKEVEMI